MRARSMALALTVGIACAAVPGVVRADDANPATFLSLTSSYFESSTSLDAAGNRTASGCTFAQRGLNLYAQHRTNARDLWFGDTAVYSDSCGGTTTRGLGDVEFGVAHGISRAQPMLYALRASVIVPTGYDIGANPRVGLGRPALQAGVSYLSGFEAWRGHYGYASAGAGVRAYSGYPAPQLDTNATVGVHVTPGALVYESFYGTTHLGAGGTLDNVGLNPTVNARYDQYQLSTSVALDLSRRIALSLSFWNVVGGSNVGLGNTVYAGFWDRF